ncbi:HDL339Wp [Eremothecium sinecaudum]|uniref:HDL339Wp n=1 Tax=Eremothecium sinecaudum TaxID=45286 RepID=A0A0X8HS28_9SACH|nr:HDL339Wp [Eremothecium sinecaudum]AMD20405.1 HDL339Wp [Eremothecium sinecaudum]
MNNSEIKTGDRVLCKVGDFPPWPAVVVPQRFLSKVVYSGKRSKNYVCVAFFNDDSYYWKEPRHLTELTDDVCGEWIKNHSKSRDNALLGAYEQAREYTQLFDFLKERFIREKRGDILEDVHDIPDGEDPFEPKPTNRKIGSKSGSSKRRTQTSSAASNSSSENGNTEHLDRFTEERSAEYMTLTSKTPSSSQPSRTTSASKRRKLDYENRVNIAQLLRNKLQRNLVQRDNRPSEEEFEESARLFKTIISRLSTDPPFFDYEALSVSKLYKLLKVITHDNNLSRYHEDCERILTSWAPIVLQIKQDKLRAENLENPNTDGSSPVSEMKVDDTRMSIPK